MSKIAELNTALDAQDVKLDEAIDFIRTSKNTDAEVEAATARVLANTEKLEDELPPKTPAPPVE